MCDLKAMLFVVIVLLSIWKASFLVLEVHLKVSLQTEGYSRKVALSGKKELQHLSKYVLLGLY
jgi:hypothetical protein